MNNQILDIPESIHDWPDWLQQQLLGPGLFGLAAQLSALAATDRTCNSAPVSLEQFGNHKLEEVLQFGLRNLDNRQMCWLMRNPELLLSLQEQIFLNGGEYWQRIPLSSKHRRLVDQHKQTLEAAVSHDNLHALAKNSRVAKMPAVSISGKRQIGRRLIICLLATSALLLLAFGFEREHLDPAAGWGFARHSVIAADLSDSAYLTFLAEAAGDWYNKVPENSQALELRLEQFNAGCRQLIAAEHLQLSDPEERSWLVAKCKVWSQKVADLQSALASGQQNFVTSRIQANGIIDNLRKALRERADLLSATSSEAGV